MGIVFGIFGGLVVIAGIIGLAFFMVKRSKVKVNVDGYNSARSSVKMADG